MALQADIDALLRLSKDLLGVVDQITDINPTDPISDAATSMPGSDVARVSAGAAQPIADAYRAMAERIRSMSEAAEATATDYDAAEQAFKSQLDSYGKGL